MTNVKAHKRVRKNGVSVVRQHARNKRSKRLKEKFNLQQGAEAIYEGNFPGRGKKRKRDWESTNDYSFEAIIRKGRQRNDENQKEDPLKYPVRKKKISPFTGKARLVRPKSRISKK